MKIVAITSCTSGLAHTYLAKERLENSAQELGINIRIETQGAIGIEDQLNLKEIESADVVLIASDIEVFGKERFIGKKTYVIPVNKVVRYAHSILVEILEGGLIR